MTLLSTHCDSACYDSTYYDTTYYDQARYGRSHLRTITLLTMTRRDLCSDVAHTDDVLGWVARQGSVAGLTHVDFNFPQACNRM